MLVPVPDAWEAARQRPWVRGCQGAWAGGRTDWRGRAGARAGYTCALRHYLILGLPWPLCLQSPAALVSTAAPSCPTGISGPLPLSPHNPLHLNALALPRRPSLHILLHNICSMHSQPLFPSSSGPNILIRLNIPSAADRVPTGRLPARRPVGGAGVQLQRAAAAAAARGRAGGRQGGAAAGTQGAAPPARGAAARQGGQGEEGGGAAGAGARRAGECVCHLIFYLFLP